MANDDEWLEDVRRWYYGGSPPATEVDNSASGHSAIGYEAAHPAIQARHWPDAPLPKIDKPAV